ncbi:MAG TPA: tRNA isopentenyl-2-thiomethyl-A-37 hydroxylase MiaE [Bryobacteraceae bacterium]
MHRADTLPLTLRTPASWGPLALADPNALLADHAILEKKAAYSAMEMLTRWPGDFVPGWVEVMTTVARDEAAHLLQVTRILARRGGRLSRSHSNPYAAALRQLVRNGSGGEVIDRLFVSSLIEARSCERFAILAEAAAAAGERELESFYQTLFTSELGHYKVFLNLARTIGKKDPEAVEIRWAEMLEAEAGILQAQKPGPRIHSWMS